MNQPYVKQYNDQGKLINPIVGTYKSEFPTRSERRQEMSLINNRPFVGNSKNHHLTVMKTAKYKRVRQETIDRETGKKKFIEHYLLC